jgi:hypothetical protein
MKDRKGWHLTGITQGRPTRRRALDAFSATLQLTRFDAGLSIHFAAGIECRSSAAMGLLDTP